MHKRLITILTFLYYIVKQINQMRLLNLTMQTLSKI